VNENGTMSRSRIQWEIIIVLGLSLGASAVYSIVTIIARSTADTPIANQTATVNPSRSDREWLDFTNQFLSLFFELFAVALVIYLLWAPGRSAFDRLGLDVRRPGSDLLRGGGLFLAIGIPGIGLYVVGRLVGITVGVQASPLDTSWWTVPILVFSALRAALVEEVIVVGYLFTRLTQLRWSPWWIIGAAALLRGTYHLYQGYGPFIGNVAMGVVFGWCYMRWGRVMPLVVAHALLDVASFVGYPLAVSLWPAVFAGG
jgi:membrane protease YdiL (CAAX protease family)